MTNLFCSFFRMYDLSRRDHCAFAPQSDKEEEKVHVLLLYM